jgi:hypothetical protein
MVCDLVESKKFANQKHKVGVSNNVDQRYNSNRTEVTIVGVAESSGLLAVDDQGQRYELLPDGNSFDFLQGLIKRKI